MRGCSHWGSDISAYLDGELGTADRDEFEAHLVACGACREALEAQRALDGDLRSLPRVDPSPQFEARFWARLARTEPPSPAAWARWLRRPALRWALAGGVCGAVAATAILTLPPTRTPPTTQQPEQAWAAPADMEDFELALERELDLVKILDLLEAWDESEEI